MRKYRSILAATFACMVLFSGSSWMVGIHICGGEIQNIALFAKADGCEKEKKLPPCHHHESPPCCQDQIVVHEAQGFKGDFTEINLIQSGAQSIIPPWVILAAVIPSSPLVKTIYHNYDPPIRSSDLTISFQVFLI